MSQLLSDVRAGGGIITAVNGGNNITVNTVAGVATVNVSGTTNHAVQVGNALGALTSLGIGIAGQVLTSNGPGLDPSFQGLPGFALNFDGNTGTATPAANTITFITANATPIFAAAGSTLTLDFGLTNLILGSNPPITVGQQNVGMGEFALASLTTGIANVGVGFDALALLTSGQGNVAIGHGASSGITSGNHNVSVGDSALEVANIGIENTALGDNALGLLTTTSFNTAVGSGALDSVLTGAANTALGINAGTNYTTNESSNLLLGNTGTVGDNNIIRIGQQGPGLAQQNECFIAGIVGVTVANTKVVTIDSTTGQLGVAAGGGTPITEIQGNDLVPEAPSLGIFNIITANSTIKFAGSAATETLDFSNTNLALGSSLPALAGGVHNVGVGQAALAATTAGVANVAVGWSALTAVTTGSQSVAVGSEAMSNAVFTGTGCVAVGDNALRNATSASGDVCVGQNALFNLSTGSQNTAIGSSTLGQLTTGSNNICIGNGIGYGNNYTSTESSNILLGNQGVLAENNTIRLGTTGGGAGQQNRCFIAGIDGVNVGSVARVVTEASDQLGTAIITAGSGVSIVPTANVITVNAVGGGLTWTVETVNLTGAVNHGYIANKAGTLAIALPAVSAIGDVIRITGMNTALGWQITQAAGQQIFVGTGNTTLGATGTITSTAIRDSIEIVCIAANTTWNAISWVGNLSLV